MSDCPDTSFPQGLTSFPEPKFPDFLDSSSLADFKLCERRFYYSSVLRLRPLEVNTHLNAGGAYAKALQITREAIYYHHLPLREALSLGLRTLIKAYGPHDPSDSKPSAAAKTWDGIAAAFIHHFSVWNPDTDYLIPHFTQDEANTLSPSLEFSFSLPLSPDLLNPVTNEPILYSGRFDMMAYLAQPGVWPMFKSSSLSPSLSSFPLAVVDDKTSYSLPSDPGKKWNLRSQFLGYAWAARALDYPATHVVVNQIAIQKTQVRLLRATLTTHPWLLNHWHEATIRTIRRLTDCWHAQAAGMGTSAWTQSFDDACSSYSGCPFALLCSSLHPERHCNNFKISDWNPVEED